MSRFQANVNECPVLAYILYKRGVFSLNNFKTVLFDNQDNFLLFSQPLYNGKQIPVLSKDMCSGG